MSAPALLSDLQSRGVVMIVRDDRLLFKAPPGVITADIRATMASRKAELLAEIRKRDDVDRRLAEQLAALVLLRTEDGRMVLVNPRYRHALERHGLL